MAGIEQQLSALLGRKVLKIRKTDESTPRISVIDVASAVEGKPKHQAAEDIRRLFDNYSDLEAKCFQVKFPDSRGRRGNRDTPVTDVQGIVEIVMLLPGRQAAQVRRQAAELLVRFLGGDLRLVDEVCRIRGLQEELAAHRPDDPRRVFGEAVEAAPEMPAADHFSRACREALARALPGMLEKITTHIDARLGHLEGRQRVNLNVRAPKRPAPYDLPIARSIAGAGRPLPLARFLDEKERLDPSWRAVRRSFAPTFGMLVQVLKKRQLRADGQEAIYVEQNHRPQLLYTERDRALMEEAWELSAAHRESLGGRHGSARVALVDRPSVLDLLHRR